MIDRGHTRFTTIPARELGEASRARWSDLCRTDPVYDHPFFTPDFTSLVAAERDDVFVGISERGGREVAYFPFQRSRVRGMSRPVGCPVSDYHAPVIAPEVGSTLDARALLRGCGLWQFEFFYVPASVDCLRPHHRGTEASPVVDLRRPRHVAPDAPRKARRIERELGPLRFEPDVSAGDERGRSVLTKLIGWKHAHFARGGAGNSLDEPWVVRLLQRLHATRDGDCTGALSALWAGDRLLAAHFGVRSARVWHWWFPSYDPEAARWSPGLVLLSRILEHAQSTGVERFDFGAGDEPFKLRHANSTVEVARGEVTIPSLASAARGLKHRVRGLVRAVATMRSA